MRKFALAFSVVVLLVGSLAVGQSSVALVSVGGISVVAGSGVAGSSGDGGPATAATFELPSGLAVDGGGNVYIADALNEVVRKVGTDGVISTVAGSAGNPGFSGDGGQATAATLNFPHGIAVDGPGNLYIADSANFRVRKVGTDGVISTVAGNGAFGVFGDGGPATSAIISPIGVAVNGLGELFITDNGRVRKVDTGGVISTVAGTLLSPSFSGDGGPATAAGFDQPIGAVAVDASGVLYIADSGHRIRKVGTDGVISTVVGNGTAGFSGDGGPATAALISVSAGLAVDGSGNLYLTDSGNLRVRRVTPAGVISTVAGSGACGFDNADGVPGIATSARLCVVVGMAVDGAGTPFFTDANNRRVYKLGASVPSAPSGVTATAGNAVAVVSWTIPVSDGGSPIVGYTAIASPGGASCNTAGATTCTVPGLTNGTAYTFTVRAMSVVGSSNPSNPSATVTPVAPVTPDVTAPTVRAAATPVFSIRSFVSLTYSGADAGTGIANFDVRYRRAPYNAGFGALAFPASWQHTTARSVSVAAVKGSTFCLSVRSRDKAGNVSGWSGERCTAVALDDRSLVASRGWSRRAGSVYYAGTITSIARKSASLTRTGVRARRLGLVAVRCRGCGTVGIYWNGRLIRKVSLNATTTANRQVCSIVDFGATRPGTLVIRTLTAGRVQIDGLTSSRT